MKPTRRTRLRPQELQPRNSTAVDKPGDEPAWAAFDVFLDAPAGDDERKTIKVQCAGLNRADAASRARWQVARDRGVALTKVYIVGAYPAGTAGERPPVMS